MITRFLCAVWLFLLYERKNQRTNQSLDRNVISEQHSLPNRGSEMTGREKNKKQPKIVNGSTNRRKKPFDSGSCFIKLHPVKLIPFSRARKTSFCGIALYTTLQLWLVHTPADDKQVQQTSAVKAFSLPSKWKRSWEKFFFSLFFLLLMLSDDCAHNQVTFQVEIWRSWGVKAEVRRQATHVPGAPSIFGWLAHQQPRERGGKWTPPCIWFGYTGGTLFPHQVTCFSIVLVVPVHALARRMSPRSMTYARPSAALRHVTSKLCRSRWNNTLRKTRKIVNIQKILSITLRQSQKLYWRKLSPFEKCFHLTAGFTNREMHKRLRMQKCILLSRCERCGNWFAIRMRGAFCCHQHCAFSILMQFLWKTSLYSRALGIIQSSCCQEDETRVLLGMSSAYWIAPMIFKQICFLFFFERNAIDIYRNIWTNKYDNKLPQRIASLIFFLLLKQIPAAHSSRESLESVGKLASPFYLVRKLVRDDSARSICCCWEPFTRDR